MQVTAWICVAGIAVVYLYGLFTGDIVGQTQSAAQSRTTAETPASGWAGSAEIDTATLGGQVEMLRREIHALKQRELVLETRIADLQSALGPMTSSLTTNPRGVGNLRSPRARPTTPSVAIARSPLPGSGFGDGLNETSSIPIAATSQPTRTLFAVELGQDPSLDGLRRRWRGLLAKHKRELKDLEIRYVAVDPAAPKDKARLKLIAGPFSNAADAAMLCAKLKARKRSCQQTTFVGKKVVEEAIAAEKTVSAPDLPDRKPSRRTN